METKRALPARYHVKVRLFNEEICFGKGVADIMRLVKATGSLAAAYKSMGMSSSKAWKILHRAEADLGYKLIESTAGGKNGGESRVTEAGLALLDAYDAFDGEVQACARQAFAKYFGEKD